MVQSASWANAGRSNDIRKVAARRHMNPADGRMIGPLLAEPIQLSLIISICQVTPASDFLAEQSCGVGLGPG